MNTNKLESCRKESFTQNEKAADLKNFQSQPLDTSVLMSMAEAYFPELFSCSSDSLDGNAAFADHSQGNKDVPVVNTAQLFQECLSKEQESASGLSENDFVQAISAVSNLFEEKLSLAESQSDTVEDSDFVETSNAFASVLLTKAENAIDPSKLIFSPVVISQIKTTDSTFDVNAVRRDFPILAETVHGKKLIWFDNAATTQKPKCVIERLKSFYEHENSNVHRGAHTLAARTTDAYEDARAKVASFLNAKSTDEIVFVRGTTEAINLAAQSYGLHNLKKDDEIILSYLEHHANIVPWQMVCEATGAKLKIIPVDEDGQLLLCEYAKLLSAKTKLVAFTHVSNAIGTVTPVAEMVELAHRYGAKVLVDGAQAVAHVKVDVQALGCDFYAFSGHKIFAPTGIGALYAKADVLNEMPPYQSGGNMISDVTFQKSLYQSPPHRFEAGTGSIADAIGLGCALHYVTGLGMDRIYQYEHQLLHYGTEALAKVPGLTLIGTAPLKTSIMSFILKGYSTAEVGLALDREGIAVRAGHHCALPILRRYGCESTVRPSLAFYNTKEEIDFLVSVLCDLVKGKTYW